MVEPKHGYLKRSIALKCFGIAAVVYGCLNIMEGLQTFTLFTTLSNLGLACALLLFLLQDLKELRGGIPRRTEPRYLFKFMMTEAVLITFLVYLTVLAPTNESGFAASYLNYHCGSMALHLLAPAVGILDFFLFDSGYRPKNIHAIHGILTPLVYLLFVLTLSTNGYRWYGGMHAPYNFINFGAPTGWWGFDLSLLSSTTLGIGVGYIIIALLLIFLLLGKLMIHIKRKHSPNP